MYLYFDLRSTLINCLNLEVISKDPSAHYPPIMHPRDLSPIFASSRIACDQSKMQPLIATETGSQFRPQK